MVAIEVRTTLTALYYAHYRIRAKRRSGQYSQRYILTISYALGPVAVGEYNITFCNGNQTKEKLLYYDPWLCYAFLQVDPSTIPKEVMQAVFSSKDPLIEQTVFTLSKGTNHQYTLSDSRYRI
jgi:hypothetical protein